MINETINNAKKEFELKNYWRAKEILRSSLNIYGYNIEIYSLYASVLLAMHDKLQAGKYCFLSKSNPYNEELEAINIFLERHSKHGYEGVYGAIPYKSRLSKLTDYSEFVQNRFIELGAKENSIFYSARHNEKVEKLKGFGFLAIIFIVILSIVVNAFYIATKLITYLIDMLF